MALRRTAFVLFLVLTTSSLLVASTDFVIPPGRAPYPEYMIVGPDNNLWFTEFLGEKIGRLTTAGVITEFPITGAQQIVGIAKGPDGNIWFTDQLTGKIGHISTSGTQLTIFSLPAGSFPQGITAGPDGNLWFVDQKSAGIFSIGRITVAGQVTEFTTNVNAGTFQDWSAEFAQITTGPDGNLWFTNPQVGLTGGGNIVGKISTAGRIRTFPLNDTALNITSGPDGYLWVIESAHVAKITTSGVETEYAISGTGYTGITVGPDGNIWFNEYTKVGYVTTAGIVTQLPKSTFSAFNGTTGITSAPDGALWFLGLGTGNVGRLTTAGTLTNTYTLPSIGSEPVWNTLGPDGAVWYTSPNQSTIGRVTSTGVATTFSVTVASSPDGIVTGSDGNLWYTEAGLDQVAKLNTSGTILASYTAGTGSQGLFGMAEGPDGRVWFGEYLSNNIAAMDVNGNLTQYPIPTLGASPLFITAGPDGAMWFTENATDKIGRVTTAGVFTEFQLAAGKNLGPITSGPDGNLWFIENTIPGAVGKITTSGTVTEYPVPIQEFPQGITSGGDGAVWVQQCYPNSLTRITPAGITSTVNLTTLNACGNDTVVGSDGKLWVAEYAAGAMGRLSAIGGTGKTFNATHGTQFSGIVATFTDGTPSGKSTDFTATINWGDGSSTSAGTVSGNTGGPFSVKGTHTYPSAGTYNTSITSHDKVDNSNYLATPGKANVQ